MKKKFDFSAILFMGYLLLAPIAISRNQDYLVNVNYLR